MILVCFTIKSVSSYTTHCSLWRKGTHRKYVYNEQFHGICMTRALFPFNTLVHLLYYFERCKIRVNCVNTRSTICICKGHIPGSTWHGHRFLSYQFKCNLGIDVAWV